MSFFRNVIITFGGRTGFTILGIVTGTITARALGPQGKGELQAIIMWPQILAYMSSIGMASANIYFMAREPENRSSLLVNAFCASIVFGLIGILVGEFIVPRLLTEYSQHVVFLLRVFLFFVPLLLFSNLLTGVFQGCQSFTIYNVTWVLPQLMYLIVLIILLFMGNLTVENTIYSWMGIHVVNLAIRLWLASQLVHLSIKPDLSVFRRTLKYGAKLHIGNISRLVARNLDQMFVIPILSPASFGLYSVAVRVSKIMDIVPQAMVVVLVPEAAKQEEKDAVDLTICLVQMSFAALAILSVLLFLSAPYLIGFFFGDQFSGVVKPFKILLIGAVFMGLGSIIDGGLRGMGKPLAVSLANWAYIVALVLSLLFLTPLYGVVGVALGYSLSSALRSLALLAVFSANGRASARDLLFFKGRQILAILKDARIS